MPLSYVHILLTHELHCSQLLRNVLYDSFWYELYVQLKDFLPTTEHDIVCLWNWS
jgi:hypothetical protein